MGRSSGLRNLVAGLIVAVVAIASALSNAALIFSGELSEWLGAGITLAMITAAVTGLVVALTSTYEFSIAGPDSNATTVLAVMSAAVVQRLSTSVPRELVLPHLTLALALGAILTGALLYGLGRARAGSAIRYIPYPLVGGFLAATGLLMVLGAVRVVTDVRLSVATLERFADPLVAARLGAGVFFAAALALALARSAHFLTMPIVLVAGMAAAHVLLAVTGTPLDAARDAGWLFPVSEQGSLGVPWTPSALSQIEWELLLPAAGGLIGAMLVTSISLLLNATGLEVASGEDVDLNGELRSQGWANLASGAVGGTIGTVSLSRSLLARTAGATGRPAGVVVAVACAAMLFGGGAVVGFVPRAVLGGLLLYLGGGLLVDWGWRSRRQLGTADYGMVVAILAMTVYWGFINAIIVGLVAGCIIFAFNYSQVRFIKHELTGREFRSAVERSKTAHDLLTDHGIRIRVLVLQGFLFFGSAHRLYLRVREELDRDTDRSPDLFVLDFRLVNGLDSSAVFSFIKIAKAVGDVGGRVLLTEPGDAVAAELRGSQLFAKAGTSVSMHPSLDRAMEWCEDLVLADAAAPTEASLSLESWLAGELEDDALVRELLPYVEQRTLEPGAFLCRQGEAADSIYFLQRGRVSIMLEREGDEPIRLRSMTGRTVIGEIGFYLRETRSASVVAEGPSVVYELDRTAFDRLGRERPEIAAGLSAMIVRVLAERLVFANGMIDALQR